jgi:hypothetical protein
MPYEQETTVQSWHGTFLERIRGFGEYNVREIGTRTKNLQEGADFVAPQPQVRYATKLGLSDLQYD